MAFTVEGVSTTVLNIVGILLSLLFAGGVAIVTTLLVIRSKRYKQYKIIIWERDAFGQLVESHDGGGIFVDPKTNMKRLFLKKAQVGLNADQVPFIQTGKDKKVYLHRWGLKNFSYIKPVIKGEGNVSFQVGEEDVNWAVNSYERAKKAFSSDRLLQYLPYVALGFTGIIILIMVIYVLKNFTVLQDVAFQLKEAAIATARASGGTVIIE